MNIIPDLIACATCMPDPNSPVSIAGSKAILLMLTVLFVLLAIFLRAIFNFARKQRESLKNNS